MAAMLVLLFLTSGFLRVDGRMFKVTGNGQVSADNKKLTLQLEMEPEEGAVSTGGVTQGGIKPGGADQPQTRNISQMELDALEEHNKFRATHGAPPMILNETMCQQATAYAQELARRGNGLMHSTNKQRQGHGENLSMGCGTVKGQTVKEAVVNWYNEVCDPGYQFGVEKPESGTGHFTQVVWKASTVLGIGKADSNRKGMKCSYIVARYKPAGNLIGSYTQNVLRGTFQQSYCAKISSLS